MVCGDGLECLELLDELKEETNLPLIITDLTMPRMDGMELLKQIKRKKPSIKVILHTGFASIDTAVMAMKSGAEDFLLRPLDFNQLAGKIKNLM